MNVIIAGDFAPRARLAQQIEEEKFNEIFQNQLIEIIDSADYSIVNLEAPITEKDYKPITKCGPNLACTKGVVEALKFAKFSAVTLANNHILDYGAEGVRKTMSCCLDGGLDVVGVGENLKEAGKILYIKRKSEILAVINCCEHEFSIATDSAAGANPLNPISQFYKIKEAKETADFVLVIVHGGHEHFQLPSPRMQETYRFFVDAGADAVVNHHQHCYSGYEFYKEKPIFYGLGNFCFDWDGIPKKMWTEGYFVEIKFDKEISFNLYPYCQYGEVASVSLLPPEFFTDTLEYLNRIIKTEELLKESIETYYKKSMNSIAMSLEPICNRYVKGLQYRGFLPRMVNKKWIPILSNVVMCESHRDKLSYYLGAKLNK